MFLKIAHAMGTTKNSIKYTNSIEAFKESYEKGVRYFEVDLDLTKDGRIVAFHEENENAELWLKKPLVECNYKEIKEFRYYNNVKILSIEELIKILEKHKDVFFIIDTKRKRKKVTFIKKNCREINFLNRKILKILNKKNIDITENKFWVNILNLLGFEMYNYYNNDDLIYKNIISKISDKNSFNRLIPQVHIENIEVISKLYDFPIKVWKDTQKSRTEADLKNALKYKCQYYSCTYNKNISEVKEKFNSIGIKVLTYSFAEVELDKLNVDGAYIDL
jgi:glycerophosphoryl diester phosphodiesterase